MSVSSLASLKQGADRARALPAWALGHRVAQDAVLIELAPDDTELCAESAGQPPVGRGWIEVPPGRTGINRRYPSALGSEWFIPNSAGKLQSVHLTKVFVLSTGLRHSGCYYLGTSNVIPDGVRPGLLGDSADLVVGFSTRPTRVPSIALPAKRTTAWSETRVEDPQFLPRNYRELAQRLAARQGEKRPVDSVYGQYVDMRLKAATVRTFLLSVLLRPDSKRDDPPIMRIVMRENGLKQDVVAASGIFDLTNATYGMYFHYDAVMGIDVDGDRVDELVVEEVYYENYVFKVLKLSSTAIKEIYTGFYFSR